MNRVLNYNVNPSQIGDNMPLTQQDMMDVANAGKRIYDSLTVMSNNIEQQIKISAENVSAKLNEYGRETLRPEQAKIIIDYLFGVLEDLRSTTNTQITSRVKDIITIEHWLDHYKLRGKSNVAAREYMRRRRGYAPPIEEQQIKQIIESNPYNMELDGPNGLRYYVFNRGIDWHDKSREELLAELEAYEERRRNNIPMDI